MLFWFAAKNAATNPGAWNFTRPCIRVCYTFHCCHSFVPDYIFNPTIPDKTGQFRRITGSLPAEKIDRSMLTAIHRVVMGDPEDRHDLGLVGDVAENTKFRKIASKINWILLVAVLSLTTAVIAQSLK